MRAASSSSSIARTVARLYSIAVGDLSSTDPVVGLGIHLAVYESQVLSLDLDLVLPNRAL